MGATQTAATAQQIVNELGRKARGAASVLSQTSESQINDVLDLDRCKITHEYKAHS